MALCISAESTINHAVKIVVSEEKNCAWRRLNDFLNCTKIEWYPQVEYLEMYTQINIFKAFIQATSEAWFSRNPSNAMYDIMVHASV